MVGEQDNKAALGPLLDTTFPAKMAMRLIVFYFIVVFGLFLFFVFVGFLATISEGFYLSVINNIELIEKAGVFASAAVYFVCGIFFAIWTYRTHHNFKSYQVKAYQEHSSSLAGWSYFIPFVNFYLPYKMVKENWDNFQLIISQLGGGASKANALILPWWLLFVFSGLIERVGGRVLKESSDEAGTAFFIIVLGMRLVAGILAIMMIRRFMKAEKEAIALSTATAASEASYESLITA